MPNRQIFQWETWVYGLVAGFIGGGANAVVNSVAVVGIAPDKFNLTTQFHNFILAFLVMFATSGFLASAAFLAKSPLPPLVQTTEVDKTITPTDGGGVHVESTIKTTTTDGK